MNQDNDDAQMDGLGLRIDDASDAGDTAALEGLDTECAELLAQEDSPDALLYYFRANIQDGLHSSLPPTDWSWHQPHRERQIRYLRQAHMAPSFDGLTPPRRAR